MLRAMSHFTVLNNAQIISEFQAWILEFTSHIVTGHYERLTFHLMCPYKAISIKEEHMKVSDYRQRSLSSDITFPAGDVADNLSFCNMFGPPGSDCSFFRLSSYIVSLLLLSLCWTAVSLYMEECVMMEHKGSPSRLRWHKLSFSNPCVLVKAEWTRCCFLRNWSSRSDPPERDSDTQETCLNMFVSEKRRGIEIIS